MIVYEKKFDVFYNSRFAFIAILVFIFLGYPADAMAKMVGVKYTMKIVDVGKGKFFCHLTGCKLIHIKMLRNAVEC